MWRSALPGPPGGPDDIGSPRRPAEIRSNRRLSNLCESRAVPDAKGSGLSQLEESLLGRWSGPRILLTSLVIGACGVAPLLLYIGFGPADGNPIGLGLLAMIAIPLAAAGLLIGLIKTIVGYCVRERR